MKIIVNYCLISLIVYITFLANSCHAQTDKKVLEFLGKDMVRFIEKADTVQISVLNPVDKDSSQTKILGYTQVAQSKNLSKAQIATLQLIIKDPTNYRVDRLEKKCEFLPDHAITFYSYHKKKQKDTLSILLNFHCDRWHFFYKETQKFAGNKAAHESLLILLNDIFPDKKIKDTLETINYSNFLKKQLGLEMSLSVLNSDRLVSAFTLNPQKSSEDSTQLFNGFLIVEKVDILTVLQKIKLIEIIIDQANYSDSPLVKNCTFLPDVGYRLNWKDGMYTDLLVAFYCDDWMFTNGKKRIIKDSRKARKDLLDLSKKIFPNDRYLSTLPLENK